MVDLKAKEPRGLIKKLAMDINKTSKNNVHKAIAIAIEAQSIPDIVKAKEEEKRKAKPEVKEQINTVQLAQEIKKEVDLER